MKSKPIDRPLPPVYKFQIALAFYRKLRWRERLQILFGYRLRMDLTMTTMHHCGKFAAAMELHTTKDLEPKAHAHQEHPTIPKAVALALILGILSASAISPPALPGTTTAAPRVASAPPPPAKTIYVAVRATDALGQESPNSNLLSLSTTNTAYAPTLAWDPPTGTNANAVTNYTIAWGPATNSLTNLALVGTNRAARLYIIGSPPKTNTLNTVQYQVAASLKGPWTNLPGWRAQFTNAPVLFFRSLQTVTNF